MSNTVDNRIVSMGFDNKQFETGVKTSVDSLNGLKKALDLKESSKSLISLGNVAKTFSLAGIAEGVQNISNKFSSLGVIGVTVLANLTNSAVNLAKKLLVSLSGVNAIIGGFKEYETQIGATQTILANTSMKGTTLDEVNAALAKLNEYSDKTIYNFTEMTRNIGTFTAAGVDLDTSVAAIKGIANLAAVSGSTSQQASTAMYQLSQALSSGTVKLMDWNSVVNAGMGGQIFQDALKETARLHGVAIDQMIKEEGSFRDTLQKGWLTSEVLTETLAKFTGDLSEQQLTAMGYTQDQIAEIIKLGQMANDAATKVKTFSQLKETLMEAIGSGWAQTWMIVLGDFEEAKSFFTDLSDIFGGLIGEASASRNAMLKEWKDLGGRTAIIDTIKNVIQGLLGVLTPLKEAFKEIFPPVAGKALATISFTLKSLTEPLKSIGKHADKLKTIFKGIFSIFDILGTVVSVVLGGFLSGFKKLIGSINISGGGILDFFVKIANAIIKFRDGIKYNNLLGKSFENFRAFLTPVIKALSEFSKKLIPIFEKVKEFLNNTFSKIDFSKFNLTSLEKIKKSLSDIFSKIDLSNLQKMKESIDIFTTSLKVKILTAFATAIDWIKRSLESVSNIFTNLTGIVKSFFKGFGKGVENVGGPNIAESFKDGIGKSITDGIKSIDWKKVTSILSVGFLGLIVVSIKKFVDKASNIFKSFSEILESVKTVFDAPKGILGSVKGVLDGVRGSLETWQQSLKADILMTIAIAIAVLSASLIALSMVDKDKLGNALGVMTLMFVELMASMNTFSKGTGTINVAKIGAQLLILSGAILILSVAVIALSLIDTEKLGKGLIAIGIALAELSIFMNTIKSTNFDTPSLGGLIALAGALIILSLAVKIFGSMDPKTLTKGLVSVGVVLLELALFMKGINSSDFGPGKSVGLLIMAGTLIILSAAVEKFGSIDVGKLQQGLIAIGIILGELAAFVKLTGNATQMISTAIGLTIIGVAMLLFSSIISKLGSMPIEQLIQGLIGLGGAMLILVAGVNAMSGGVTGALAIMLTAIALGMLVPTIMALGSMDIKALGIGLLALAAIFTIFGLAGLLLTPLVPTLLLLGVAIMLFGLAGLAAGAGLLAFSLGLAGLIALGASNISTLKDILASIAEAIANGIVVFAETLANGAPSLAESTKKVFRALMDTARELIPEFIDTALFLVESLLKQLGDALPDILQAGIDIILSLLKGISDNIYKIVSVAIDIVTKFIDGVADKIPDVIDSGFNLIISFINGLADSIEENGEELRAAVGKLATAIVDGLCDGLTDGAKGVVAAIGKLGGAAIEALKTLLGIFSPSTVTTDMGEYVGMGFINGILSMAKVVGKVTKDLGNRAVSGLRDAIGRINDSLNENLDVNPTIRPVIDLTDIISGRNQIDNLFSKKSISMAASVNRVSSVANGMMVGGNAVPEDQQSNNQNGISFVQNNYSPKALSRIEIYRLTKKQLIEAKGLV